jgi:hypothetical protein
MTLQLNYDELHSPPANIHLELYRLHAHDQIRTFKEELRRDRAIVERALDQVFQDIDLLEGPQQ